jgi:hypothetical protein
MMTRPSLRTVAVAAAISLALASPGLAQSQDPLAPQARWTGAEAGAAATPPMGWNSWNAFHTDITEDKLMGAARTIVDSGLAKLGYVYINIDDGWWIKRRQDDGRLQVRTAIFPSAAVGGAEETSFRPLTDRLHAMGLKAGIYTDIGRNACSQAWNLNSPNLPVGTTAEREVGLYGNVDKDIRLFFGDWNFDYVKVDACGLADYGADRAHVKSQNYRPFEPIMRRGSLARSDESKIRALYQEVADALKRTRPARDYILSICNWGAANVRSWGKEVGNLWRTSDDIQPNWTQMQHSFDSTSRRALYAHPGAWNDPDMLYIGTGDFDANHLTEARTHFSLWAIANAPLLIGYDLRDAPKSLIDIFGNADVVAVNQDAAGNQGVVAFSSDDAEVIVKTLKDPSRKAVVIVNRGLKPIDGYVTAAHLRFTADAPIALKDLWSKEETSFTREYRVRLAPRESRMFIATGKRALADGLYLSEMPGSINVAVDGVVQPELDPMVHRAAGATRGSGAKPSYAGWGGAQADSAPYGTAIQVAGREFATGVGILSGSRMEVRNDGHATFRALVGVDDETRNRAAKVRFYVYGDGRLLAQSAPLGWGEEAVELQAPVTGVKIVELVARNIGADRNPSSVAWAEARLTR